jgi:hypothetical protein
MQVSDVLIQAFSPGADDLQRLENAILGAQSPAPDLMASAAAVKAHSL